MPLIPLNRTKTQIPFPFEEREKTLCIWSYGQNIYHNALLSQAGREYITSRLRDAVEEALRQGKRSFFCFRPNPFELTALDIAGGRREEYPELRTALFLLEGDRTEPYKSRANDELYFFRHTGGKDMHREYYELICRRAQEVITILSPERTGRCPLVKLAAENGVSLRNVYDGYVRLMAAAGYTKHAAPPEGTALLLKGEGYASLDAMRQALLKDMQETLGPEDFEKILLLEKLRDRMDLQLLRSKKP